MFGGYWKRNIFCMSFVVKHKTNCSVLNKSNQMMVLNEAFASW